MTPVELGVLVASMAVMMLPLAFMLGRLYQAREDSSLDGMVNGHRERRLRESVRACPCTVTTLGKLEAHPDCRTHHVRSWRDR